MGRATLLSRLRELTGKAAFSRVLIIDDNELDRYLVKQHLRKLPLAITEAETGAQGVRYAVEHGAEMIFLDLTMPEMTGYEVLEQLKSSPVTSGIPVAIITSRVLSERERSRLMESAAAIVSKEELNSSAAAGILSRVLSETGALPALANAVPGQ
ncbi:MAG TPA: response regulator [Bryobacteraceae bacterium]|nr:response regulator [Bryobacteraceae bacterium]